MTSQHRAGEASVACTRRPGILGGPANPSIMTRQPSYADRIEFLLQLAASLHPLVGTNVLNSSDSVMDALGHGTHISGRRGQRVL